MATGLQRRGRSWAGKLFLLYWSGFVCQSAFRLLHHEHDLCGHVLAHGGRRHVALPLIAQRTMTYRISETETWTRKKGEFLRPDAFSKKDLQRLQEPSLPSLAP